MPTYKSLPTHKKEDLPLYRPVDRWVAAAWGKKQVLLPIAVVGVIALIAFVGLKSYGSRYEAKASNLLETGQWEAVTREYPRSGAARLARMKLGKQALDAKDYEKAIQWYGAVSENSKAPAILRVAASQNLGLAHLKKGEAAKAVDVLGRAAKDPANRAADYTQLLLARAQEMKGDAEAAKILYQSLSEGASEMAVKEEAKERLSWIVK